MKAQPFNPMLPHGSDSTYSNHGCRCHECRAEHRKYQRKYKAIFMTEERERQLYEPWVILNFPVALVARQAFPDDTEAINAAYGPTP